MIESKHLKSIVAHLLLNARLPLLLVAIFVLQNQYFNSSLQIIPHLYIVRGSVSAIALGALLYMPALFFHGRKRYLYLFIAAALASSVFVAEFLYYRYSGGFLQSSALVYAKQSMAIMGTVVTLWTWKLILFVINIAVVVIAWASSKRRNRHSFHLTVSQKLIVAIVIIACLFDGYGYIVASEHKEWGNARRLYNNMYDMGMVVGKIGIVNFFVTDMVKALTHFKVTDEDKAFVATWQQKRPTSPQPIKPYAGIAKGRNLILIQVESLENAVINTRVGEKEITPYLNHLLKDGVYFPHYFTQIGAGTTADAEFVTLNSLYYLPNEVAFLQQAHNLYRALPQLLIEKGYHTAVLHGDVASFWNRSNMYPSLGYQTLFTKSDFKAPRDVGFEGLGDDDFFQQSIPYLKQLSQPFMATVITLSSHTPFILPKDLQTFDIPSDSKLKDNQRNYLQSVHYVDEAIEHFIEGLKKERLYDNSLIVIFGDHGSFSGIADALHVEQDTPASMHNTQVPLIILAPGTSLHGTIEVPMSHLDLYPTLAHVLGVTPPSTILGQDIFSAKEPVVVRRKSISGVIGNILSSHLIFNSSDDGIFEHGTCTSLPERISLDITKCRTLYDTQSDTIRVSDTVIRGDLLHLLQSKED